MLRDYSKNYEDVFMAKSLKVGHRPSTIFAQIFRSLRTKEFPGISLIACALVI